MGRIIIPGGKSSHFAAMFNCELNKQPHLPTDVGFNEQGICCWVLPLSLSNLWEDVFGEMLSRKLFYGLRPRQTSQYLSWADSYPDCYSKAYESVEGSPIHKHPYWCLKMSQLSDSSPQCISLGEKKFTWLSGIKYIKPEMSDWIFDSIFFYIWSASWSFPGM